MTERESLWRHAVACFEFLAPAFYKRDERRAFTYKDSSEAIKEYYSLEDARTKAVFILFESLGEEKVFTDNCQDFRVPASML